MPVHETHIFLDEGQAPTLFLEPVIERADPLIVHTREFQKLLKERYGVAAKVAPFTPHLTFTEQELSQPARLAARERLGLSDESFVLSTFGQVDVLRKGIGAIIAALDLLRSWKVPAELYCVGNAGPAAKDVRKIAEDFGLDKYVHVMAGYVETERYRDFLVASDVAVQVRNFGLGQPSAALTDCVAAGLPTVTTEEMAACCEAPDYVMATSNHVSPLFVAEHLSKLYFSSRDEMEIETQRRDYCDGHNFDRYVQSLTEILGF